jgi:5,10-methylenetetrahydromethanopterin reductase
MIRSFSFTGTVGELRDRVHALQEAGYDQLAVQLVPGQEDALDDWAKLMDKV